MNAALTAAGFVRHACPGGSHYGRGIVYAVRADVPAYPNAPDAESDPIAATRTDCITRPRVYPNTAAFLAAVDADFPPECPPL